MLLEVTYARYSCRQPQVSSAGKTDHFFQHGPKVSSIFLEFWSPDHDSVESTLVRVNQSMLAKQFNVTTRTINRVLWNAKKLKQQLLTASGDLRRNRKTKYSAIEEKVVAFVCLLRNIRKPMPVSEYCERVCRASGQIPW